MKQHLAELFLPTLSFQALTRWLLKQAGLTKPDSLAVFNTWIGTVELLKARKPC